VRVCGKSVASQEVIGRRLILTSKIVEKKKMKKKILMMVLLACLLIPLTMSSSVQAIDHPGCCGQPEEVTTIDLDVTNKKILYGSDTYYVGLTTDTPVGPDLFLDGPSENTMLNNLFNKPYVDSYDLTAQKIRTYEPMFAVESDSWYSHTLDYAESQTDSIKWEWSLSLKLGTSSASVKLSQGGTTYKETGSSAGWSVTASGGDTKIVFVEVLLLHISGSVTYNHYLGWFRWTKTTVNYDVTVVHSVNMGNRYVATNPTSGFPIPDPHYWDDNTDGIPDVIPTMGNFWVDYTEASSVSDWYGFEIGILGASISGRWTFTSSSSTYVKHSFTGTVPSSYDGFSILQTNFFNLNIVPVAGGSGGDDFFIP